jgi:hypothetical protein
MRSALDHVLLRGIALSLGLLATAPALADDDELVVPDSALPSTYRGHVSIGFQSLHTGSLITDNGTIPGKTETDTQLMRIGVDYLLGAHWQIHASVPYIRKRSNGGPGAHRPSLLTVPHPEADFLDDGLYHSNWQDFEIGLSYLADWHGLHVEPSVTFQTPASDYSFFANAATGQHVNRLHVGVDVSRQALGSNFYWTAGYSYVFQEQTLGINSDKNHVRLGAGYFFTPHFSLRAFGNGSYGKGRDSSDFSDRNSEAWYHHDQTSRHNYAIVGLGANWSPNARYTFSVSAATMVWGRTVHDLKHAYEFAVTRGF